MTIHKYKLILDGCTILQKLEEGREIVDQKLAIEQVLDKIRKRKSKVFIEGADCPTVSQKSRFTIKDRTTSSKHRGRDATFNVNPTTTRTERGLWQKSQGDRHTTSPLLDINDKEKFGKKELSYDYKYTSWSPLKETDKSTKIKEKITDNGLSLAREGICERKSSMVKTHRPSPLRQTSSKKHKSKVQGTTKACQLSKSDLDIHKASQPTEAVRRTSSEEEVSSKQLQLQRDIPSDLTEAIKWTSQGKPYDIYVLAALNFAQKVGEKDFAKNTSLSSAKHKPPTGTTTEYQEPVWTNKLKKKLTKKSTTKATMTERQRQTTSKCSLNTNPPDTASRCKNKCCRKKSKTGSSPKKTKSRNGIQQGRTESYVCCCASRNGLSTCSCGDDLEAIEEEQECEELDLQTCSMNQTAKLTACPEEDPCGEFFDIMRETMEDAVKKSVDDAFGRYFSNCVEKIETLTALVERHECFMSKMYEDLNDKISYYGERNAQQFQYLCVRMEHDRLFYQQQQEYFLKRAESLKNQQEQQEEQPEETNAEDPAK